MQGLLDQVRSAIGFAQDVTTTVADGYQNADQEVAGDLHHSGAVTNLLDPVLGLLGLGDTNGSRKG
jgi:hypothetical protein